MAALKKGRKVRAPSGRMLGKSQEGKFYGKCHRNYTADEPIRFGAGKGEMVR